VSEKAEKTCKCGHDEKMHRPYCHGNRPGGYPCECPFYDLAPREATAPFHREDTLARLMKHYKTAIEPCLPTVRVMIGEAYDLGRLASVEPREATEEAPQPENRFNNYTNAVYVVRGSDEEDWTAHALAYDLVGSGPTKEQAVARLRNCLIAQIAVGRKQGLTPFQSFFPAPPEYWTPPYEIMELPTEAEIAACKIELDAVSAPPPATESELRSQPEPDVPINPGFGHQHGLAVPTVAAPLPGPEKPELRGMSQLVGKKARNRAFRLWKLAETTEQAARKSYEIIRDAWRGNIDVQSLRESTRASGTSETPKPNSGRRAAWLIKNGWQIGQNGYWKDPVEGKLWSNAAARNIINSRLRTRSPRAALAQASLSWGSRWRVGRKVLLNVYEGDTPVCQCHDAATALRIVDAMNAKALAESPTGQPHYEWTPEVENARTFLLAHFADKFSMEAIATAAYILGGKATAVAQTATPLEGQWISVKERLPERKILVWSWNKLCPRAILSHLDSHGLWCGHYTDHPQCEMRGPLPTGDPTHWQPLPDPPSF
jgi:Protein of unknown function (DUF551)